MFEGIDFKHILAYFLAIFNVMLAAVNIDGLTEDMQADVVGWIEMLTGEEA